MNDAADKIIAAYKEHYDFPPQGESHMHDCISMELDSLAAPSTIDEAKERAAFARWYVEFFSEPVPPNWQSISIWQCWLARASLSQVAAAPNLLAALHELVAWAGISDQPLTNEFVRGIASSAIAKHEACP